MVKIYIDSTTDFKPWAGAKDTYQTIVDNNKLEDLDYLIEELYPEGIEDGKLNDILWFDSDWVLENLGIIEEDEEDELTCDSCGETIEEQDLWAHEDGNSYCCNCYPNI